MIGIDGHCINYRHVVDQLFCKQGRFFVSYPPTRRTITPSFRDRSIDNDKSSEQSGRDSEDFFPDVGIQPMTDGGLYDCFWFHNDQI